MSQETHIPSTLRPALYLIPVGLGDTPFDSVFPAANRQVITQLRHFIVENLRTSRRFLKWVDRSIDIDALTFDILDEHTPESDVARMLDPLARGEAVGVMSEAGCPAVADPGALAVAEAQRRGYEVVPLVGPSSILLGLMGSGFNGQSFAFLGYLPIDRQQRRDRLQQMRQRILHERQTQIFIETPYRNNRLIAELATALPADMLLCVASELTTPQQSIITRRLADWARATYDYDRKPTIFLLYS
ncbi:MAG: SAM-dependent methyltransferase [Bacteroidales bacterium]|nr:SAM-dependent methyltransferase [Bacteroidales bacterium]